MLNYRNIRYRGGITAAAAGLSLTVLLAACGAGSTTASSSTASSSTSTTVAPSAGNGGPAGGSFPGTAGSVAALSGSSMEVQNQQSGQVTVGWTATTSFTRTATVSASSLVAGDCVVVTGTSSGGTITARSVSISPVSSSGTCSAGARPGGRGGTGGAPRAGAGGGTAGGAGGSLSFASGKVASVSGDSLVVSSATSTSTSNVTLTSATTYTESKAAAASNLAVGDCVTATGTTDSTGAVTASAVRITSTGGQSCTAGFGGAARGGASG